MGRKKLYNRDDALLAIKHHFWQYGFEATSLFDLERVSGLPKQTLYREFTDKEGMYVAALAHYQVQEVQSANRLLKTQENPKARFQALFDAILADAGSPSGRLGCFICNAAAERTNLGHQATDQVIDALGRLRSIFADALNVPSGDDYLADSVLAGYIGFRNLVRNDWPTTNLQAVANDLLSMIDRGAKLPQQP